MAERTAILIDSKGELLGTASNPLYVGGFTSVGSFVDLTDVNWLNPGSADYAAWDPVTKKIVPKPMTGTGLGDVVGPSFSEDRAVVVFDGVTGKRIASSGITITDTDELEMGGNRIESLGSPVNADDAATKSYVDQFVHGLSWQDPVVSIEVSSPASPGDRARYIVDEGAVGDWIGHSDDIAIWHEDEGIWYFDTPGDGWAAYNTEIDEVMVYNQTAGTWNHIGSTGVPEAPVDNKPYCRMNAGWVRTSSDGSGILPLDPKMNCLLSWADSEGTYAKNAGRGAYVENGLFVRTPWGEGLGEYLLKLYASRDTRSYAGVLDISDYVVCATYNHPNIGFVSNLIKSVDTANFGGGVLISGHGKYDRIETWIPPFLSLTVRGRGATENLDSLRVFSDGSIIMYYPVTFNESPNIPTGKTYNINGAPHTHTGYLASAGGALSGDLDMDGHRIRNVADPVDGGDAVNLDYVSAFSSGIIWKDPVLSQVASPPGVDGRYLVASSGTSGVFVGEENHIATRTSGNWTFEEPSIGWAVANQSDNFGYVYNGAAWSKMPGAVAHSSLQGLTNSDDHTQYLHVSISRPSVTAVHTFTNGFNIGVTTRIDNLNANFLDGAIKADFALTGHTHTFDTLDDFRIVLPASGQVLAYDESLGKFVNSDTGGSGAIVIDPNHEFADATARDTYFGLHPEEIVDQMFIVVGTGFQQRISAAWEDRTPMIRGPAGVDGRDGIDGADGAPGPAGADGAQGIQGVQGIQGPAGASGTSINVLGAVASPANLPGTGDPNDAWIVNSDGDLYVWGQDNAWHNIGMVQGPQGIQGVQGPQGATGAQGPQGLKGDTGDKGDIGPEGAPGPRGPSGISIGWESPVESRVASPIGNYDYFDRFLVNETPVGVFFEHANEIATWLDTDQWYFDNPVIGSMVYVLDVASYYERTPAGWVPFAGGGGSSAQVNADWSASTGVASILNKPTIPSQYVLPVASPTVLGGVKIGANISIDANGVISVASSGTPTTHATSHVTGGSDVIANAVAGGNSGLMSGSDKTKLDGLSNYTLPVASASILGGIKVGSYLTVDGSGLLAVASLVTIGNLGAVDNAVLRVDGTGMRNAQGSAVTIDDSGSVNIPIGQKYKIGGNSLTASDVGAQVASPFIAVPTTVLLSASPTTGMSIEIVGMGYIWTASAQGTHIIRMGASVSGVAGTLVSTGSYDCAELTYIGDSTWVVRSSMGVLTIT